MRPYREYEFILASLSPTSSAFPSASRRDNYRGNRRGGTHAGATTETRELSLVISRVFRVISLDARKSECRAFSRRFPIFRPNINDIRATIFRRNCPRFLYVRLRISVSAVSAARLSS